MQAVTDTDTLPLDWNEWRKEWITWLRNNDHRMRKVTNPFRGKNFLADDILGSWKVHGRTVELSEVVFPNLSERNPQTGMLLNHNVRMIGITWATGTTDGGTVVRNFSELERALFGT